MSFRLLGMALLTVGLAQAEETVQPTEPLAPRHFGYAFDNPEMLLRQRVFGLAHGVHLLLSGCLDKNENAEAVQQSYDTWHARQSGTLETVLRRLAEHHFGTPAQWQDIARALGLQETIYPALGAVTLHDACATLPQALQQPRYDFAQQLEQPVNDVKH